VRIIATGAVFCGINLDPPADRKGGRAHPANAWRERHPLLCDPPSLPPMTWNRPRTLVGASNVA